MGCTGLGLWYREQLLGRLKALRELAVILELLMSEIRYGKATLPECCKALSSRVEEPYRTAFLQAYEAFEKESGESFQVILSGRLEQVLQSLPLKKEHRDIFLSPFQQQGFLDGQMQLRSMEQSLERLREQIQIQSKEQREKCRMSVGLGVMGGLLLVIILV